MKNLPTGTVTFLFTDIEGSTALLQHLGDHRYAEVLAEHQRLLRDAFAKGNGQEIDTQGDAFLVAFSRARDAMATAVAAQQSLMKHPWPDGASLRVRMGLHTGEPVSETRGYVGLDLHRAARIGAAGHGGQILLSDAVSGLAARDLPPGVSLRDLGTHHLKDLRDPEHLFQVMHPDLPADFPPIKSLNVLPNNLPRQLTSFIGREREMAEVKRLLSTAYLVTLTGAGGAGKTRLALQVAADLLGQYPDGVWFVELAPLSDPDLVPKTVASALDVPEQQGRQLTETLADSLRAGHLLLLLDNCEHVLSACQELADKLLRACPNIRILATSRETLGVEGESTYRVPSLELPDPNRLPPLATLAQYEAIRLFVERAALGQSSFSLTTSTGPAVAQICHRLDGIPLAIEFAAARVKVLSVDQIAARLDDRFRLLTAASRKTLPRHQTLRAAMDWSYDLLSEPEQTVLRRLSVFAGGWILEAAEAVCAGEGVGSSDILDLLTLLVDKSLVVVETQDGAARYRLLETVRQYGGGRLLESVEAAMARRRHRDWYLQLAEYADPKLRGPEQEVWLERLETEHDNLRTALGWSRTDEGGAEAALRLAGTLTWYWNMRGHWIEGRQWLDEALAQNNEVQSAALPGVFFGAAGLALQQGDYQRASDVARRGLTVCQTLGDKGGYIRLLSILGNVASQLADHGRATSLHEECLALSRELDDMWLVAWSLSQLADSVRKQGNHERALSLCTESIVLDREVGDRWRIAVALRAMGIAALSQRNYDQAAAFYTESLKHCEVTRNRWVSYQCLEGLACVVCAQGHYGRAATLFGAGDMLQETLRARRDTDQEAEVDRFMSLTRTSLGDAGFASSWAEGRAMTLEQAIEYALAAN